MQRPYTNNLFLLATTISSLVSLSSLINHPSARNCGYSATGWQSGLCYGSSGGGGSVDDVVTDAFFNGILDGAASSCEGNGFYTRSAFLDAVGSFDDFGTTGSTDDRLQEIAAFFANVAHETRSLCNINEIDGRLHDYCEESSDLYPCVPGQYYYGRGPLQLEWNYNYGAAGNDLGFDGLGDPDIVARNAVLSFRTALWYWMRTCHGPITSGLGFGATIQAIGNVECQGGNVAAVNSRVEYYVKYYQQLGVSPSDNLYC